MKRRIVITGANGFLGRYLASYLFARGMRWNGMGRRWEIGLLHWTMEHEEFMAAMREQAGMPIGLPAARWMLEVGGADPENRDRAGVEEPLGGSAAAGGAWIQVPLAGFGRCLRGFGAPPSDRVVTNTEKIDISGMNSLSSP